MDSVLRVLVFIAVLCLAIWALGPKTAALGGAILGGGMCPKPLSFPDKPTCEDKKLFFRDRGKMWRYVGGPLNWAEAKARIVDTYTPVRAARQKTSLLMLPSVAKRAASCRNGRAALERTLRWIFDTHKTGLFIRIRGGRLVEYMPFNNRAYRNPMANVLATEEPTPEKQRALAAALADRPVMWCQYWPQGGGHWKNKKEKPPAYYNEFLWWWEKAASARQLADCDLFLNTKDQLIAPEPGMPSHPQLPLAARKLTTRPADGGAFTPVLSQCTTAGFADIPFVTADDISRSSGLSFPNICFDHYKGMADLPLTPWTERDPRALFRGSATGCGTTPRTNPRLGAVKAAASAPELFDVGLTGNRSTIKHYYADGSRQPRPQKGRPADRVAFTDHGKYRTLLDIDGNVLAYRLGALFAFGATVVRVAPGFNPWFADHLKTSGPEANCQVADTTADLVPVVRTLRADEKRAERIGANGRRLFDEHLTLDALLDYTEALTRAFSQLPE